MKKSRFTEEKIIELSREYGVSTASIYGWKSKCAGLEVSQLKRLKELDDEEPHVATPLILVGQVNPILEARLDSAMRSEFRAYVDELEELYPESLVRSEELPRHSPDNYFPDDRMHINHQARTAGVHGAADGPARREGRLGQASLLDGRLA